MDMRALGIPPEEHNFVGNFHHVVDGQGRIQFPKTLRRGMRPDAQDTLIITEDPDGCLAAYPLNEWEEIRKAWKAAGADPSARKARNMLRRILSQACESKIDAQGRITITSELLETAEITDEAVVIGAVERIELWNPNRFQEALEEVGGKYEKSAGNLIVIKMGQQAGSDG
jgi:MraZ protein